MQLQCNVNAFEKQMQNNKINVLSFDFQAVV